MSLLAHGALGGKAAHLCIDMQNLLGPKSPWHAPWVEGILPNVLRILEARATETVFTRFVPPGDLRRLPGMWKAYYRRWAELTPGRIDPTLLDLLAPLVPFAPPALVLDKPVYSPFTGRKLAAHLAARGIDTLVITGAETDVCVLATVLGAVDRGYRVIVVDDALCSSSDETHDALLTFYRQRLSIQVELASTEVVLEAWR